MTLAEFRARIFNPEKWIVTGLTWAGLTLVFMSLIELVLDGGLREHNWITRIAIFAMVGLAFGLVFRWACRREKNDAR